MKEFEKSTGVDIAKSAKCMRRLKTECVKAKQTLSTGIEYEMTIDQLAKGEDLELTITRDKFEEISKDCLARTIPCVEGVLADGGVNKN